MSTRKIVLDTWMGLGDNLQVSTIPRRIAEKTGEKCVWISTAIERRADEIDEMVWKYNPYIAGFTDEPGINYTHKLQFGKYGWIENWERIYGLDEPYSVRPEVYMPKDRQIIDYNIGENVVIDLSYSKSSYTQNVVKRDRLPVFENMIRTLTEQTDCTIYRPRNVNLSSEACFDFFDLICSDIETKIIEIQNVFEYADIITQCRQFISTHSGSHCLGSALRSKSLCLIPEEHYNRRYFVFDNVRYIPV